MCALIVFLVIGFLLLLAAPYPAINSNLVNDSVE
jgi:competence protein ComGC